MKTQLSRRRFLKGGAAAIAIPTIIPSSALGLAGTVAPSNRIAMAIVGIGPRGRLVLDNFLKQPEAQFVTACDVQKSLQRTGKMMIDRAYKNNDCTTSQDMMEVFARKDIDAVLIATGERWHGMASILAAKAGKDIYSEKPCSMTIAESQELDETITTYGRVFQAGTQRRSVTNFQMATMLAREGKLGNLHTLYASIVPRRQAKEWLPEEPAPPVEELDWDRWLGPAPWRPYNKIYLSGAWRGHRDFEPGNMFLDWGAHTVDLCQWALGADGTTPVEYVPNGDEVRAVYANGVKLVMRLGGFNDEGEWIKGIGTCPIRYEGDEGWVETGDSARLEGKPVSMPAERMPGGTIGGGPYNHIRNFLDCVKTREQPICNASVARSSHIACHVASIARDLGRRLVFDPVTETITNDDQANRLSQRARRAPWNI